MVFVYSTSHCILRYGSVEQRPPLLDTSFRTNCPTAVGQGHTEGLTGKRTSCDVTPRGQTETDPADEMQSSTPSSPGLLGGESFHHVGLPSSTAVSTTDVASSTSSNVEVGFAEQNAQLREWQHLQREVQQDCVKYREQLL